MQDNRFMNTAAATAAQTDVGLRAYMLGVYNHMTTALLLTGFFAFATKWAVLNVYGLGQLLYGTPLKWVIMLAPLGMVLWLSARINRMSATKARNLFYIYGAIMGLSLASILFVYTGASVARAFFITAGAFAGLSLLRLYHQAQPVGDGIVYDDWPVRSDHCVNCEYLYGINPDGICDFGWWCVDFCRFDRLGYTAHQIHVYGW